MIADTVKGSAMGNLMRLMCLGGAPYELEAVCRTSDGCYLGQVAGDVGYNAFLGRPKHIDNAQPETRQMVLGIWEGLDEQARLAVKALARRPGDGSPIPLDDFLPAEGGN